MLELIQLIATLLLNYLAWKALRLLTVIAEETRSKQELTEAIEKFGQLIVGKKNKVVAFKAKSDEEENAT